MGSFIVTLAEVRILGHLVVFSLVACDQIYSVVLYVGIERTADGY